MKRSDTTLFGRLLKQHRIAHGLTQEALAERAGLGVPRVLFQFVRAQVRR